MAHSMQEILDNFEIEISKSCCNSEKIEILLKSYLDLIDSLATKETFEVMRNEEVYD